MAGRVRQEISTKEVREMRMLKKALPQAEELILFGRSRAVRLRWAWMLALNQNIQVKQHALGT